MIDVSEKESVEDFLESTKNDFAEPQYTDKEVILTFKPETIADPVKFGLITKRARVLGGTVKLAPTPGFRIPRIPLSQPSPLEHSALAVVKDPVVPPCGLLAHIEKSEEYGVVGADGKIQVIKCCENESMTLLTDIGKLPISVQQFITKLAPNTVAVFDVYGRIFVEVSISMLKTMLTLKAFISFYRGILAEFPTLANYVDLYERSVPARSVFPDGKTVHVWMPIHFYVVIRVKEMTLERLRYFFSPESDFPVETAISFLLTHGMSDSTLQSFFGIPPRTYGRYKTKIDADGKTPKPKQPQISAIGKVPS